MIRKVLRWLAAAADVLLPRACIVCGERLNIDEKRLCLGCQAQMPLTYFWSMDHNMMSDKFNEQIQKYMSSSLATPWSERYAYACALFFYSEEADYKVLLYDLKYRGDIWIGHNFGEMLGRRMASCRWFEDADAIVPVPLHWRRKWSRGYNQAEVIAEGLSAAMGVPVRTDILYRRMATKTQTKLDVEAKALNVAGAFEATRRDDMKHIILVDDLFTTGSTLMACFVALRAVFPPSVRISVATLGCVGQA